MQKVFLTGAGGFIGKYLSKRLIDSGFEVHGLFQKQNEKVEIKGVIPHFSDLRLTTKLKKILQKVNPDYIIHLAARTEVEKSFYEPIEFSEINYCGTVNLIEIARNLPDLKLLIFSSTMETYGEVYTKDEVLNTPDALKPYNEETEQKPNAPYAVAKLACEKYLEYAGRTSNLPYVILRQTNTYGRYDNDFFVVEQFITQMLKNPLKANFGYGEPWRNFIFIDDLIDLYLELLRPENSEKVKKQVFCIGPENALPIKDLAKMIADKLGWKGEISWGQKRERIGEIYYLNSTAKKAKELIGWESKVNLSDGLDRTIQMWKEKLKIQ